MPSDLCVYLPRNPKISPYYQCVEDHFETFDQVYGKDRAGKIGTSMILCVSYFGDCEKGSLKLTS